MNILYVCSACSPQKYYEYVEKQGMRVSQQSQKYNFLLAEGFAKNGANVRILSSRPINRKLNKKIWFSGETEVCNGITFFYVPFVNLPVLRSLFLFFGMFFRVLTAGDKPKVVCDGLNIVSSIGARWGAGLRGFHTVGIVTDVPCHRPTKGNPSLREKINLAVMKSFSSYLLLTEKMNHIVNPKNRPYIVLEGHADEAMAHRENSPEQKYEKKVCIYAGTLRSIYGIDSLVRGFLMADLPDAQLHIFGNGDYAEALAQQVKIHDNIFYHGICPNSHVVQEELKATLLINPRPTHEDYTQYSFPSKNMEYMASGTPVLTTRLPGMPDSYAPYVYFIEDESPEGICCALRQVLSESKEVLHEKGLSAKKFILEQKNNRIQAKRVMDALMNGD